MDNIKNLNILNILDTSWISISNYFINNQININENDTYNIKFTKYLLKYKRLIGLILLIILLIIGYYYYSNESDDSDDGDDNNNKLQSGGSYHFANQAAADAHLASETASKGFMEKAKANAAEVTAKKIAADAAAKKVIENAKDPKVKKLEKKEAKKTEEKARQTDRQAVKQAVKDDKKAEGKAVVMKAKAAVRDKIADIKSAGVGFGMKEGSKKQAVAKYATGAISKGSKGALKGINKIGAAGAQSIRENADWFYGFLYSIIISLAVCIITIPSIAFFVMGLVCYVLLKNNMKTVKGL